MKQRLDVLMTERGLAPTRTQAQALIMAGQVSAGGKRLDKPGMAVDSDIELHVKDQPKYVSRAGDKLASVVEKLNLDFGGKVILDVGSSTGGFTDYALQHGAEQVFCVGWGVGRGRWWRGRLVGAWAGKLAGQIRIPFEIVPGDLYEARIEAIT